MNNYLEEKAETLESQLETWRSVVEYEGLYEVSDLGRIRSLNYRGVKGFVVVLRQAVNVKRGGYHQAVLCKNGIAKNVKPHQLVMEAFVGPPEDKEVNHKNGLKSDNSLGNLEYVTRAENCSHAYKTGLRKAAPSIGENHGKCKTTEDVVFVIRALRAMGIRSCEIAPMVGLHHRHVRSIANRRTWKHLP